jgi:hypothetical protein
MLIKEAISILDEHNKWRRGADDIHQQDPVKVGLAIDKLVSKMRKIMFAINEPEIKESKETLVNERNTTVT